MAGKISAGIGEKAYCLAGDLSLEEFIALISAAPLVISVNTATIHIAAATNTPVIVLYALTNPQHTPWKTASSVLYYSVPEELKSRNAVVNYVSEKVMDKEVPFPEPEEVLEEVKKRMKEWSLVNAVV